MLQIVLWCLLVGIVSSQRGCNSLGCDSRGLYCQADFQVNSTKAKVVWEIPIGPLNPEQSLGCVGNDANLICPLSSNNTGFIGINSTSGEVKWQDKIMKNPSLPIMNEAGAIIATDGHHMEMLLPNGTRVDGLQNFTDGFGPLSSILYVSEPNLYFFVSHSFGGFFFYDSTGMCIASAFIDVEQPKGHMIQVWVPINQPIVNNELDTPAAYVIARNNVTGDTRLFAMNFNHQPPYLREKWNITIKLPDYPKVPKITMLTVGSRIYVGIYGQDTAIYTDAGTHATLDNMLGYDSWTLSSYSLPTKSNKPKPTDSAQIVWSTSMSSEGFFYIRGWDNTNNKPYATYNLIKLLGVEQAVITSQIMVFGYSADDITLVMGVAILQTADDITTGSTVIAIKASPGEKAEIKWAVPLGQEIMFVKGQIIGVREDTLVAVVSGQEKGKIIGIRMQ